MKKQKSEANEMITKQAKQVRLPHFRWTMFSFVVLAQLAIRAGAVQEAFAKSRATLASQPVESLPLPAHPTPSASPVEAPEPPAQPLLTIIPIYHAK
jgi:hypothetical protein